LEAVRQLLGGKKRIHRKILENIILIDGSVCFDQSTGQGGNCLFTTFNDECTKVGVALSKLVLAG
jgi:NAD/NADP transhydrogenase alpha subunit